LKIEIETPVSGWKKLKTEPTFKFPNRCITTKFIMNEDRNPSGLLHTVRTVTVLQVSVPVSYDVLYKQLNNIFEIVGL